jgi:2-polyprenyl-3-methyl-5-hydroxy-6-metoxy-1,4-benzoquinol methylase
MHQRVNQTLLASIVSQNRKLSLKSWWIGLPYERCAELPWIVEYLQPRFEEKLNYLDIGSGESPLPSYLHCHTDWDITCIDKCESVHTQLAFAQKTDRTCRAGANFQVIQANFVDAGFPTRSFDIITCVSVIEHFEGTSDSTAIKAMAALLRPRGVLVVTTLINDGYRLEFFVRKGVYGSPFDGSPVFYQRHYDVESFRRRIIEPSGLNEHTRLYFGDYKFQWFERLLQQPRPVRLLYAWQTPKLASLGLSYRPYPISRKNMDMNTSSGVISVLEKSAA